MRTSLLLFVIAAILCVAFIFSSCGADEDFSETSRETSAAVSDTEKEEEKAVLVGFINSEAANTEEYLRALSLLETGRREFGDALKGIELEVFLETSDRRFYFGIKDNVVCLSVGETKEYIFFGEESVVCLSVGTDDSGELEYVKEEIDADEYAELFSEMPCIYGDLAIPKIRAEDIEFSDGEYVVRQEYIDGLYDAVLSENGGEYREDGKRETDGYAAFSDFLCVRLSYTVQDGKVTGRKAVFEASEQYLERVGADEARALAESHIYGGSEERTEIFVSCSAGGEKFELAASISGRADNFPSPSDDILSAAKIGVGRIG